MANEPIRVEGLTQFRRSLQKLDSDLPKALRVGLNAAVQIVVDDAQPKVPRRSGRAAASIRAQSTQGKARISGGGSRAPYLPWLDFGGRVGRRRSVARQFLKRGRYIWASFDEKRDEVFDALQDALVQVAQQAGLEVTRGG